MTSTGSTGIGHFSLNLQPCCNKPLYEPEKQKMQGRTPTDLSRYCQCKNPKPSSAHTGTASGISSRPGGGGVSNFGTHFSSGGGGGVLGSNASYIRAISGGIAFSSDMDARSVSWSLSTVSKRFFLFNTIKTLISFTDVGRLMINSYLEMGRYLFQVELSGGVFNTSF